jgi:hypothetical protein
MLNSRSLRLELGRRGTSFPPTALLVAHTVAARLQIPYLADFRDAWTTHYQAPQLSGAAAIRRRSGPRRSPTWSAGWSGG